MHRANRTSTDQRQTAPVLRTLMIGVLTLSLLPVAALAQPVDSKLPKPPSPDAQRRRVCEVLGVPAGNELVVRLDGQNTTVRMIGLFVPRSGTVDDEAQSFSARLLRGESVYLEYEPDWPLRDKGDRLWAYVYRAPDGLLVNLELIRLGYARLSAAAPFAHQQLLRAYERHARRNQKGLWRRDVHEAAGPPASQPAKTNEARAQSDRQSSDDTLTVYVTKYGKKYHLKDCQHVRGKGIPMSRKEARAKGYSSCSRCKPPS